MQTIEQYFLREDTPMVQSPTGLALVELLKLNPTMPFEEARIAVNAVGVSAAQSPKAAAQEAFRRLRPAKAA